MRSSETKKRDIVDGKMLSRIASLGVRAGQVVEGALTGHHKSPHHGSSIEFAQHREYSPGDEIKHIDWKAFAKSDRYHVKQYEDETNLRCYLLVDTSGSMDYGRAGGPTKIEYAARLAASMAWLMLRQGDAVGLLTFGETLGHYIPPRARTNHFWNLVRVLESEPVDGGTNAVRAMERIAEVAGRRSLVIVLSDCFDFDHRLSAIARQLHRRRHAVSVFQVLDPDEIEFPFRDLTRFESMEAEEHVQADPRGMRDQYLEEIRAYCENLRRRLLEGGVTYHRVRTDTPVEKTLINWLGGARS